MTGAIIDVDGALVRLGRQMRSGWHLKDGATFLNHGSFGACPVVVLQKQSEIRRHIEKQPDEFFFRDVMPKEGTWIRRSVEDLAPSLGTSGDQLCFVPNATTGTEAILRSIDFNPGDRILLTDHQYGAVKLAIERRCRETGAIPVEVKVPVPADADEVVDRITQAAKFGARLAIIDHITSPTALVFPIASVVRQLRSHGVPVLVDGAHALGQIDVDLPSLQPDWYVTNAHKWFYAPKGCGLLYCAADYASKTRPAITSHFVGQGFPLAFDYVGTTDCTAWLTAPTARDFHASLGADRLRKHNGLLIDLATQRLESIGASAVGPRSMAASMRSFVLAQSHTLPTDADLLQNQLWDRHRISVRISFWRGWLMLRLSAQAYVGPEDVIHLAEVLDSDGWPGRP